MFHLPESRFTAFVVHLLLSLVIFASLFAFTYFVLLPGFLFYSEGGITILSLIGGIDVILGPLVTLIIYKKTKPSLKFDLSIIALLQIAALLYGLHALWSVRPLAVFYAKGQYHVTYQDTFTKPTYSDISKNEYLNRLKPPTLAISVPNADSNLTAQSFAHVISTGTSYFAQQNLYQDYQTQIPLLRQHAMTPEQAVERSFISKDSPLALLDKEKYGFFTFVGNYTTGHLVLDLETGKFIDMAY